MEAGVVIDCLGNAVHWHLPPGRSGGALPDSHDLWEVLWKYNQEQLCGGPRLLGFAHTHPGRGMPGPSREDLTTFDAVERGLGRSLRWWILNEDHFIEILPEVNKHISRIAHVRGCYPSWVHELARLSGFEFVDRRWMNT